MPAGRVLALLLVAAALGAWAARSGGPDSGPADSGATLMARVARVVDGDTVVVDTGGRRETVRYIGIDTPESVKPGTPVQCFAKAASHENARLVAGRTVRLVVGVEPRDRYGRVLAYVWTTSRPAVLVQARLVAGGYARTLTIPPNDRLAARFATLQNVARQEGRGLWGHC